MNPAEIGSESIPWLWMLWTTGGAVGVSLAVVHGLAFAIAFPNPFRVFRKYGEPEDCGLRVERLRLPNGNAAWWLPREGSTRAVIICHGRSRGKAWMLPLIERLARRWSVLAFDFPGHGENRYGATAIGGREALDVGAAIAWLEERGERDIVVYGVSMGGAASILWLGVKSDPAVTGLVTDGAYDRLESVLANVPAHVPIPRIVRKAAVHVAGKMAGYDPILVCPVDVAAGIRVPWLLLHGDRDRLVPPRCAQALAAAARAHATLHLYRGEHDEPSNPFMQAEVESFIESLPATDGISPLPRLH